MDAQDIIEICEYIIEQSKHDEEAEDILGSILDNIIDIKDILRELCIKERVNDDTLPF